MLRKLIIIIVAAGATACALLVNRQHRIDTAHAIAVIHQRLLAQEQALWRLRSEVAAQTRPDQIRERVEDVGGSWMAIPASSPRAAASPAQLASSETTDEPPGG